MATAAQNRQQRALEARRSRPGAQPGPPVDPAAGFDRIEALGIEAAARGARPSPVPGLDIGKLLPGPLAGIFGATANPDAPRNVRAREDALAGAAAAGESARLLANADIAASGIDTSEMDPALLEGLQTQLAVDRAAGEKTLNEIQASQGITSTPLQRQQLDTARQAFANNASRELREVAAAGRLENTAKLEFNKAVNTETAQLRRGYQAAIKPVVDMLQSVQFARGQMELGTPEAAFNSARIFIQQLDKSMVTNPELQAIMQQPGVSGQVANIISWLEGKGKFDENSRRRMVQSMAAIGQVMKSHGDGIVEDMTGIIENNPLPINPANVITMAGFANREFDLSTPRGDLSVTPGETITVDAPP